VWSATLPLPDYGGAARDSGAIPRRIGTAAVAGHFDEYSTYQELAAHGVSLNANVNYRSDS